MNQLLSFQGSSDKNHNGFGQAQAVSLELDNSPARAHDSFIIKDIDSPSKMQMRLFLDRQRSTSSMNDFGKVNYEVNQDVAAAAANALDKHAHLQNLLLGSSPNKNNQELSILQNIIKDEDDDRFGNLKMSDEDIQPQDNMNGAHSVQHIDSKRFSINQRSKAIKKDHRFSSF